MTEEIKACGYDEDTPCIQEKCAIYETRYGVCSDLLQARATAAIYKLMVSIDHKLEHLSTIARALDDINRRQERNEEEPQMQLTITNNTIDPDMVAKMTKYISGHGG